MVEKQQPDFEQPGLETGEYIEDEKRESIDGRITQEQLPPHSHTLDKVEHSDLLGLKKDDHSAYINKDGTRDFTGEQSMGTNKLTNVVDPTADQDAATKKYVDDTIPPVTITCIAGETINGATRPYAVFLATNNRVYIAEADQDGELDIIGFAITTANALGSITVQTRGVVGGFAGAANLTQWSRYYLADQADSWWAGAPYTNIKATSGTIMVGIAISTTELLIWVPEDNYQSGDILISSNDAETTLGYITSYTKAKETIISKNGSLRIKFDMNGYGTNKNAYGRIYINGVAVGTEQNNTTASYVTYSEDIGGLNSRDLVQIYIKGSGSEAGALLKNFRLYSLTAEVATVTKSVL